MIDPQITIQGHKKRNTLGRDCVVFSVYLGYFEVVAIVNIPTDDESRVPVYIKFKVSVPNRAESHQQKNGG